MNFTTEQKLILLLK